MILTLLTISDERNATEDVSAISFWFITIAMFFLFLPFAVWFLFISFFFPFNIKTLGTIDFRQTKQKNKVEYKKRESKNSVRGMTKNQKRI